MQRLTPLCLLSLILISWTPIDYYVSPKGNDTNLGTIDKPFYSLEKAQQTVRKQLINKQTDDITIWIEDGIYMLKEPLTFGPDVSGIGKSSVSYKAMKNAHPIISGGIEITGWEKNENGIWKADLPEQLSKIEFRELFINQDRAIRAKHPNSGYIRVDEVGSDHRTNFKFKKGDFPTPQNPNQIELVLLHDWSISRIPLKTIDSNQSRIETVDSIGVKSIDFFYLDNWEKHPRYFLENDIAFLDTINEWFVDTKTKSIYLKLAEGEDPRVRTITVPVSGPHLIKIAGTKEKPVSNISFEGLTFRFCSWLIPTMGYAEVQASFFDTRSSTNQEWQTVPSAVDVTWGKNCTFSTCTFKNLGGSGINFGEGSKYCKITNSHFEDISGVAIMIGEKQDRKINNEIWWKISPEEVAENNIIEGNIITNCGKQFYGAVGIWCGITAGTIIARNHLSNLPYSGISIGWEWSPIPTPCRDNHLEGNHIHDIMQVLSDGGGIYMLGLQPGSTISNNLIHDVTINAGQAESNGMFLDEGTTNVEVTNNIIYNIAKSPLRFHKAKKNLVKANILSCDKGIPPIRYNVTNENDIHKAKNISLKKYKTKDQKILNVAITKWMNEYAKSKL